MIQIFGPKEQSDCGTNFKIPDKKYSNQYTSRIRMKSPFFKKEKHFLKKAVKFAMIQN